MAGSRAVTEAEFVDLASYWSAVFDASRSSDGPAGPIRHGASASHDTLTVGAPAAVQAVATATAWGSGIFIKHKSSAHIPVD